MPHGTLSCLIFTECRSRYFYGAIYKWGSWNRQTVNGKQLAKGPTHSEQQSYAMLLEAWCLVISPSWFLVQEGAERGHYSTWHLPIDWLPCSRHSNEYSMCIVSFNLHSHHMKWVLLSPRHRWEHWGKLQYSTSLPRSVEQNKKWRNRFKNIYIILPYNRDGNSSK